MYLYSRCVNGQEFAMNLTLNLETCFKVSEHPFIKDTLWVKYNSESEWAKGVKKSSEQAITDWQKYGKTDEQRGPNNSGVASPTFLGGVHV